jgi:hypothetical protein
VPRNTNDRQGLERLVRYGARGPLAESGLSKREDGRYEYIPKRGDILVLSAEQLVKRLVSLVPPAKFHLTSFHGVLASHAKLRHAIVQKPQQLTKGPQLPSPLPTAEPCVPSTPRRPRIDWATLHARTWQVDVWACPCGGRRTVRAVITNPRTAEEILRNLGRLPKATSPPTKAPPPERQLALAI